MSRLPQFLKDFMDLLVSDRSRELVEKGSLVAFCALSVVFVLFLVVIVVRWILGMNSEPGMVDAREEQEEAFEEGELSSPVNLANRPKTPKVKPPSASYLQKRGLGPFSKGRSQSYGRGGGSRPAGGGVPDTPSRGKSLPFIYKS